jgi:hypothetical protein
MQSIKPLKSIFFVEVTDTFGGEANYCWVKRFKVHAISVRGAITKVSRELGLAAKKQAHYGDLVRYDFKNTCICAFVTGWENDLGDSLSNVVSI